MTKITRRTKRKNKTKVKKSSKTKSKLIRPNDTNENVSAPEMVKQENHQDDESQPPDRSGTDILSLDLIMQCKYFLF